MAFLSIPNVSIRGMSVCVPNRVVENRDLEIYTPEEIAAIISVTGIERRFVANVNTTCSDLCEKAFQVLMEKLGWETDSIEALSYLSMTDDFPSPDTACVLHGRLGLSEECYVSSIRHGCCGWIIGVSNLATLVSTGQIRRAVLLNGDVNQRHSPYDKVMEPIFCDAGAVTALEYNPHAPTIDCYTATRGKDYAAIMIPAGGTRRPLIAEDLEFQDCADGSRRRNIDCRMDGLSVFSFGISAAPRAVRKLWEHFSIDPGSIDRYFFHQANLFMNERIRKILKIDRTKVPYILKDMGNASSASIPANMVVSCREDFERRPMDCIGCAFGLGLQYGAIHFKTDHLVCPKLVFYS